jgi:hypothetical protein
MDGMVAKTSPTYTATIYMAGDYSQAQQVCREYVRCGLCVTINQCEYIYSGGQEAGFAIGLLQYPRFQVEEETILERAHELAVMLIDRLCQLSALIVTADKTEFIAKKGKMV